MRAPGKKVPKQDCFQLQVDCFKIGAGSDHDLIVIRGGVYTSRLDPASHTPKHVGHHDDNKYEAEQDARGWSPSAPTTPTGLLPDAERVAAKLDGIVTSVTNRVPLRCLERVNTIGCDDDEEAVKP